MDTIDFYSMFFLVLNFDKLDFLKTNRGATPKKVLEH